MVHLWLHLSPSGGFLREVVARACNKWYQGISGSVWDCVLIPKASVAVWQRSCVDLETALELFVGSCVYLKTACRLLEESIQKSISFRKLYYGFAWKVKILSLSNLFYLTPFVSALLRGSSQEDGWRKYIDGEIHESTSAKD